MCCDGVAEMEARFLSGWRRGTERKGGRGRAIRDSITEDIGVGGEKQNLFPVVLRPCSGVSDKSGRTRVGNQRSLDTLW